MEFLKTQMELCFLKILIVVFHPMVHIHNTNQSNLVTTSIFILYMCNVDISKSEYAILVSYMHTTNRDLRGGKTTLNDNKQTQKSVYKIDVRITTNLLK